MFANLFFQNAPEDRKLFVKTVREVIFGQAHEGEMRPIPVYLLDASNAS